jgi:phosphoribosylamine---glycine ligase
MATMQVMVIGGGGREHALAWKLAASARVSRVFVAPGNAGTAREPKVQNVDLAAEDIPALVDFARREQIELVVVGPEQPLVAGVVDAFEAAGIFCLGPRAQAAELEGSKSFAKDFMQRHGIPTARYGVFTDFAAARAFAGELGAPLVVKASGLAAGKGVVVARTLGEAEAALRAMLLEGQHGRAGAEVVVEDFLPGEEASYIVIADGTDWQPFATSQDHKARDAGDRGPNTGGMGAYSPAPVVTDEIEARIAREVIEPALAGLAAEGRRYRGFLYAGLMIAPDGRLGVLEFNCRMGDPETQPIMMRLGSDLVELCLAVRDGHLRETAPVWSSEAALGVVLAAEGYPGPVRSGDAISGLDLASPASKVFHSGTRSQDGTVVTAGGRVLCVVGTGPTVADARMAAYGRVAQIRWTGMFHRADIGHRALARPQLAPGEA